MDDHEKSESSRTFVEVIKITIKLSKSVTLKHPVLSNFQKNVLILILLLMCNIQKITIGSYSVY